MADQYTVTTRTSYGVNIKNAFIGAILGLILFIASFFVLWINEGRINWSMVAKISISIQSDLVNKDLAEKFVSTTGLLITTDNFIGDDLFLKSGNYIAIQRKSEMYSWKEFKKSESEEEIGGATKTTTTYSYKKVWLENPENSAEFEYEEGHENPRKRIDNLIRKVKNSKIGVYEIDMTGVVLPDFIDVGADAIDKNAVNQYSGNASIIDKYVFVGRDYQDPSIGDLRISYSVVESGIKATIFGKLDGDSISPYSYKDKVFYRIFRGSREEAVSKLQSEYVTNLWLFRLIGFLMMWFGLMLILNPINTFLKILPILSTISKFITGLATFLISLVLSVITILISMIFHNIVVFIVVLVIVIILIIFAIKKRQNKNKFVSSPAV